jgi:hypothetical protein
MDVLSNKTVYPYLNIASSHFVYASVYLSLDYFLFLSRSLEQKTVNHVCVLSKSS